MLLQELETAEQAGKLPSWFAWKFYGGGGEMGLKLGGGGENLMYFTCKSDQNINAESFVISRILLNICY